MYNTTVNEVISNIGNMTMTDVFIAAILWVVIYAVLAICLGGFILWLIENT